MTIVEAARYVAKNGGFIARKGDITRCYIAPTNRPECCVVRNEIDTRISPRWNPLAEDLYADYWAIKEQSRQ